MIFGLGPMFKLIWSLLKHHTISKTENLGDKCRDVEFSYLFP